MAPNGYASPRAQDKRTSRAIAPQDWLEKHGQAEYQSWKQENSSHDLSYEQWKDSENVYGLSLYYATLSVFNESDSNDEEEPTKNVPPHAPAPRSQGLRQSKKPKQNGHSSPLVTASTASSPSAVSEERILFGKRKRKPRRKYLSEEIVGSDIESEPEPTAISSSVPEPVSTDMPTATKKKYNRKSLTRKPRRKPLSEEMISVEDDLDDSMDIDEIVDSTPAANPSPAPLAPPATTQPLKPMKTILRLSMKGAPKAKSASETNTAVNAKPQEPKSTPTSNRKIGKASGANSTESVNQIDVMTKPDEPVPATKSPDTTSPTATRRGLRVRRPAQKRPYSHDAHLYDSADPGVDGLDSPEMDVKYDAADISMVDLDEGPSDRLTESPGGEYSGRNKRHFKGKGRAWKKEESDEDQDYKSTKKKAKSKPGDQATTRKKIAKPRKSMLSEDIIRDESDSDVDVGSNATLAASSQSPRSGKGRKSEGDRIAQTPLSKVSKQEHFNGAEMTDASQPMIANGTQKETHQGDANPKAVAERSDLPKENEDPHV